MASFHKSKVATNAAIYEEKSDASADLSQVMHPSVSGLRGCIWKKQRSVFMLEGGNCGLPLG